MPVDHAHVRPVELLPPQAGSPERLDRLLQVGPESLEGGADSPRQAREPALDPRARVPELGVEPHPVEVARQGADIGRDRHPVVIQNHDDRRAEPARLADRLERHAAGHGAVADHGHDLRVSARARVAHALLDSDRVADRGRGVSRPHDVVVGLGDRAERRQAAVLADRAQTLAPAREDLVRVSLVADVPEDLVARRVQH